MTDTAQAGTDEAIYVCHTHGTRDLRHDQMTTKLVDGQWYWTCKSGVCAPSLVNRVQPEFPPLLDGQTYQALVAQLVAVHPEDLVNLISRVIHDRTDVSNPPSRPWSEGSLVVPGCPGQENCPDEAHLADHPEVTDRTFVITLNGFRGTLRTDRFQS